jgi:diguanylate cyclase (GGDEF)-like protein
MGNNSEERTNLFGPRGILDVFYLPHFIKKNNLSENEVRQSRLYSAHDEVLRSILICFLIIPIMLTYLIYTFAIGYLPLYTLEGITMFSGCLVMLVSAFLYLLYYLLTYKKTLGLQLRETIQLVLYLLIMIGIFLFYVSTKARSQGSKEIALGYVWFLALAITPPSFLSYWIATSLSSIVGASITIAMFEDSSSSKFQCIIIISAYIVASYLIRSHDFIAAYYKRKVQAQNDTNAYFALTDALTGAENRRGLEQYVSLMEKGWIDKSSTINVYIFDIDRFKEYNDAFGHSQGDAILKKITDIMKEEFPNNLDLFRLGGDEFVIVSTDEIEEEAIKNGMRILSSIHNAKIASPKNIGTNFLTVSIGLSRVKADNNYSFSNQLKEADAQLYYAKQNHRGSLYYNKKFYNSFGSSGESML